MSRYTTTTIPIHQILSLIAEDKDDLSVSKKVSKALKDITIGEDLLKLEFEEGLVIVIRSYYGDYNLYISDINYYENNDTPFSLYSLDRVKWYLERLSS